ncbi:hypothetical protein AB6C72_25920, partial [Vibrio splendidus]
AARQKPFLLATIRSIYHRAVRVCLSFNDYLIERTPPVETISRSDCCGLLFCKRVVLQLARFYEPNV